MRKNSLRKRAFTLVELIVVIAIVAILVAVLVATFMKVIEKSHESTALSDANNLIKTLIPELIDEENSTDLLVFCAKGGKIYAHGFQHDIRRVLPYKNGPFVQDEEDINDQVNGAIITALTTDGYITVDTSVTEDSWRSAANIKQMLEGNNFNTRIIVVRADYLIDDSFFDPADISGGGSETCIHAWDEGVVVNEANCGVAGSEKFTCSLCGSTKTEPIPATGAHTWGEWTKNETTHTRACTVCHTADSGSHDTAGAGGKCSVCGYGAGVGDPCAEGHTVASWTVIQEATCTEAGYKVGNCTVCGELRVEEIPAAHNYSTKWYANNYSHYHICYECYDSYSSNTNGVHLIDKEDHDDVNGYCSVCGLDHSNAYQYITNNCGVHNMVYNVSYSNMYHDGHCKWCGYSVWSESHNTDGEGGCCSKCGYKACEHTVGSWTVTTPATCTTDGQKQGTCTKCSKTIKQSIPATGHTITNYTEFDVFNHKGTCSTCGQTVTQSHQYTLVSSADGVYHYQCACGVIMEVSGTNNPTHVHTNITINYNEWGKTTTTIDDKTYSVWICTCGGTSSCGATITYYVPVS